MSTQWKESSGQVSQIPLVRNSKKLEKWSILFLILPVFKCKKKDFYWMSSDHSDWHQDDFFPWLARYWNYCTYLAISWQWFLYKSTLNLGKFEAVEEVSAYSWVFFIKKIFLANENSNKWTCIHLQAKLNREGTNTYTFLVPPVQR